MFRYKDLILPVIVDGFETWPLTLRAEYYLRVFEKRVLRKIFGPKRDEVTGEWWRLYNVQHQDLYCSPNIVWVMRPRRMRWSRHVAHTGGQERFIQGFGGET